MAVLDATHTSHDLRMQSVTLDGFNYWLTDLFNGPTGVGSYGPTQFTDVDFASGAQAVWQGSNLSFSPLQLDGTSVWAQPLSGTVTSLTVLDGDGEQVYMLSGFSLTVSPYIGYTSIAATVFAGADSIKGGAGDDLLRGFDGADSLVGGFGDDTLIGDGGNDLLNGGDGADCASYADEWAGITVTYTGAGSATVTGDVLLGKDTLSGIENIIGTSGNDKISGNTTGLAAASANYFDAGSGNDTVDGGLGDDTIVGGFGVDVLNGGAGNDWVDFAQEAAYQAVSVDLGTGVVSFSGPDGYAETAKNFENATGGAWDDTLVGTTGDNVLVGGAGVDQISGGAGNDTLDGIDGTDVYSYMDAEDQLDGGAGDDTYLIGRNNLGNGFDRVTEAAGGGNDTVVLMQRGTIYTSSYPSPYPSPSINAPLSYTLDANVENLVLDITHVYQQYYGAVPMAGATSTPVSSSGLSMAALGNAADNDISVRSGGEVVAGQYSAMFLVPVNGSFTLYGDAGNDTLSGGDGADLLNGGQGNDVMDGGLGNDTYVVDAGDTVFEQSGGGTDTVVARFDGVVLGAELENLRLDTVSGVIKGTGNAAGNRIVGNDQNNALDGLAGDDTLSGGAGNDVINGGAGDDSIQGGSGNDVLDGGAQGANGDTVSYAGLGVALKVDLSKTMAQDTGAGSDTLTNFENLVGGTVGDTLTGSAGANKIWGGAGHDLILGGGGADKLYGEAGNDTLVGGAGADVLSGGAGKDVFQFGATGEIGTTATACDLITDFTRGQDKLDLSAIDANTTVSGNDAFVLLGAGATGFTAAGQLRLANGVLYGNTDADFATAEFALQLTGVRSFSVADFIA